MKEDIYNFQKQLLFSPEIKNSEKWGRYKNYLLIGMGGSHLSGDFLKAVFPEKPIYLHSDYGLPAFLPDDLAVIIVSYSGNTEEVLNSFDEVVKKDIPVAVITRGGDLLTKAEEREVPFIRIPQERMQPRLALGYIFLATLKLLGEEERKVFEELYEVLEKRRDVLREEGKKLVSFIQDKVPVVYATQRNSVLASIWKINFNETSKIPSFYNIIPEMNHNEMTGFDVTPTTKHLSEKITFIFLVDEDDHSRNKQRMDVLEEVFKGREFNVVRVKIEGGSRMEKIFSSIILSAWTAYYLADFYQVDPSEVPMVEEFKKMI